MMKQTKTRGCLNSLTLKLLAMALMLCDHLWGHGAARLDVADGHWPDRFPHLCLSGGGGVSAHP